MDLYQLKAFFYFGKVRNFTRTAEIMNLTQSAVSHALGKLEKSVKTPLIERKGRSYRLTEAGEKLYGSCEKIFYELENVTEEINEIIEQRKWQINLGAPVEFGTTILMRYIGQFLDLNPEISIDFHFSHNLASPFIEDRLDLMIDCKAHDFSNCKKISLIDEQYVVIASKKFAEAITLRTPEDLKHAPILSIDKEGVWWKNFYEKAFGGRKPKWKFIRINHIRGIINGAIQSIGIGFVPLYTVANELKDGTLVNPFPGLKNQSDVFSLYVKHEKGKMKKIIRLVNFLKSISPLEFQKV